MSGGPILSPGEVVQITRYDKEWCRILAYISTTAKSGMHAGVLFGDSLDRQIFLSNALGGDDWKPVQIDDLTDEESVALMKYSLLGRV